jgi:hypothetical protein
MNLPKPLRALYPDGGVEVDTFEVRGIDQITAHPDGTLRVWRGTLPISVGGVRPEVELPYYPIQAVGMTKDELERALSVAKQLLAMPHNRNT